MEDVSTVAAGDRHSFIVKTDRSLWIWEIDGSDKLGDTIKMQEVQLKSWTT
jgi:alpha-tubulin suppressor-like RCC1 family protein